MKNSRGLKASRLAQFPIANGMVIAEVERVKK
jgi:hypothetical protein